MYSGVVNLSTIGQNNNWRNKNIRMPANNPVSTLLMDILLNENPISLNELFSNFKEIKIKINIGMLYPNKGINSKCGRKNMIEEEIK